MNSSKDFKISVYREMKIYLLNFLLFYIILGFADLDNRINKTMTIYRFHNLFGCNDFGDDLLHYNWCRFLCDKFYWKKCRKNFYGQEIKHTLRF